METIANQPVDLRDRALVFSRDIIRFLPIFRDIRAAWSITDQLVRSATAIGANFIEAKNASSKKDFRNKVYIAKKEASETLYWLKLCEEFTNESELSRLQAECHEIILILQKIINTLNT